MKKSNSTGLYEIIQKSRLYNTIVIFGYSDQGKELVSHLKNKVGQIKIYYIDNNEKKWCEGVCYSPKNAAELFRDALYIIVSKYYAATMYRQCLDLGIPKNDIIQYVSYKSMVEQNVFEQKKQLDRCIPHKKICLEVHLAEHCNLNCKFCNHFSPLAVEEFIAFEEFQRDIERLSYVFAKGEVDTIYLLGGEPLLNKDIIKFMQYVRKMFSDTLITIITNGILIPQMKEDFWDACRDLNVHILITKYPLSGIYEKVQQKCELERIAWSYTMEGLVIKKMTCYPLEREGNNDIEESFMKCDMANNCITLKKGKLYTCPIVAHIGHLNSYFKESFIVDETDGIDIYHNDGEQILNFLSKPILFCRYCNVKGRIGEKPWEISKREVEEWIVQ